MSLSIREREALRKENEREIFKMHLWRFTKSVVIAISITAFIVVVTATVASLIYS